MSITLDYRSSDSQTAAPSPAACLSLLNSTTTEQISEPVCTFHNRCMRRDCDYCQTMKATSKAHEAKYNLKNKSNLYLLTLTIKSSSTSLNHLDSQLSTLKRCLKRLLRSVQWQSYVSGGLWGLDATYSYSYGYHPHLHLVIESKPINRSQLSTQWAKITGGSNHVHIEKMGDTDKDNFCASRYCLKPAFKGFSDDSQLVETWLKAVGSSRKNDRFGSWRNTKAKKTNWVRQPKLKTMAVKPHRIVSDPF